MLASQDSVSRLKVNAPPVYMGKFSYARGERRSYPVMRRPQEAAPERAGRNGNAARFKNEDCGWRV